MQEKWQEECAERGIILMEYLLEKRLGSMGIENKKSASCLALFWKTL